jgi:tRNA(Ile)-lysidine synthetase-like protein
MAGQLSYVQYTVFVMELPLLPTLKGRFVIAVSGGIDSVVLLHALLSLNDPDLHLIAAHVNHGMRQDAGRDAEFVRNLAQYYGIPFELHEARLGEGASEAEARRERYDFLHFVCKKHEADGIITAHHQDDVLETIILNIKRGTGWRGLSSLRSHTGMLRPLINSAKAQIYEYAMLHKLQWVEDESNQDITFLRNKIRHTIIPYLTPLQRQKLLELWQMQCELHNEVSAETAIVLQNWVDLHDTSANINRYQFIMVSENVAIELLQNVVQKLTKQRLLRAQCANLLLFIKTARPGGIHFAKKGLKTTAYRTKVIVELDQN